MKAVVFHGIGDIRLEEVPEPKIEANADAIVKLTASAICGTDLHMVRGTVPGMKPGTILGHEGVGIIEEVGPDCRNLQAGDRVVIPSTIACGACMFCRLGEFSQCDVANPNGSEAGTAFYGGPAETGPFNGLQAEFARIPFAPAGLVKLPDLVTDEQAILLSDIFPTGYFGIDLLSLQPGESVAVFGCGPVGQFSIASARLLGSGRIFAIDTIPSRLEMARNQGAEVIDYNAEHPVEALMRLTNGVGVDAALDAVGVDAVSASSGPAAKEAKTQQKGQKPPAPQPQKGNWQPGNAPGQVLSWATQAVRKAGKISIIGVYPETMNSFPIGVAMNKNLQVRMGNCNHRRYLSEVIRLVASGVVDPLQVLTHQEPLTDALSAYQSFDARQPGWIKVELLPTQH
jgi:threonine dehydrogenase-like Zn-dependent dehydrogenase